MFGDIQLFEAAMQCASADSENPGGFGAITTALLKGAENKVSFRLVQI